MALTDSLVSHWKLDEASGDRSDAHGTCTLTDNNTVGSATGKINSAADFESGSSEYLSCADTSDLSMGDIDFAIACWVNAESFPGGGNYPGILSKKAGTAAGESEYSIYYDGDSSRFGVGCSADGGAPTLLNATSLGAPSTATWYFIVYEHDATANTISVQVNNGTIDSTSHSGGAFDGTNPFTIGRTNSGSFGGYWDGLIDEVSVWKRKLTTQERTDLYNSGNGFAYPWSSSVTGAASITQAANTLSAAGAVAVAGASSQTQAGNTTSAAGAVAIVGASSQTQAGNTTAAAGAVAVVGASSQTQAANTMTATGGSGGLTGDASITQAANTLSAAGAVAVAGASSQTQASQSVSGAGTLPVVGSSSQTQAGNTLSAAATHPVVGAAAITQAGNTVSASDGGTVLTPETLYLRVLPEDSLTNFPTYPGM